MISRARYPATNVLLAIAKPSSLRPHQRYQPDISYGVKLFYTGCIKNTEPIGSDETSWIPGYITSAPKELQDNAPQPRARASLESLKLAPMIIKQNATGN